MTFLKPLFLCSAAMAGTFFLPFVTDLGQSTARPADLIPEITGAARQLMASAPLDEINVTLLLFALGFALAALTALLTLAGFATRILGFAAALSPALPFLWLWYNPSAHPHPVAVTMLEGPYTDAALVWTQLQASYSLGAGLYAVSAILLLVSARFGSADRRQTITAPAFDYTAALR